MHSKRIRTLFLAGLLLACSAACNGLHTRLGDRIRAWDSRHGDDQAPGVARLDTTGPQDPGQQTTPDAAISPIHPAPPASSGRLGAEGRARSADDQDPMGERLVERRRAARALLTDLGARITENDSGEVLAIDLSETGVTDDDLRQIAVFSQVRELNLRGTIVSDAGLAALSDLSELEFLGLTGTKISDAGLDRLGKLERLRFLTLGRTDVTDAGLSRIIRWSSLEGLNVKATRVTDRGAARLQRQLPGCRIIVDSPGSGTESRRSRATPSDNGDSSRLPVLPRPRPGSGDETDTSDPDSVEPLLESRDSHTPVRERLRFSVEDDWEAAVTSPVKPTNDMDPQQRLMQVLREKLEDPDVLKAIAQVQLSQQQPDEALRLLEAAVERAPEDRELRYMLGITRARCGDFDAAYHELELSVGDAAAHYNLGVLLHETGDDRRSIREFQRALRCDPGFQAARQWLTALTLPDAATDGLADSQVLSEEEVRSLILQWTDRRTPKVQSTPARLQPVPPKLETVSPIAEPTRLEAASLPQDAPSSHVENASAVEPELYPRFGGERPLR